MQDVTEQDKTRGMKPGERRKQTKIQKKNDYEFITISFNLYSLGLQFKLKILKILFAAANFNSCFCWRSQSASKGTVIKNDGV